MIIFIFYDIYIQKIINMNKNKIKITESDLHTIISETLKRIIKEDFDYNYGSKQIADLKEIYQHALQIKHICKENNFNEYGPVESHIYQYATQIMNECINLKKELLQQ